MRRIDTVDESSGARGAPAARSAPPSDVAFSPSVKAQQERMGSRAAYRRMEEGDGWETTITPELAAFLAERDSFYLATASADGQPYIQHRGGPRGFLRPVDARTLGFVEFSGNRQYITLGNLAENDRAFIFLMDYARRRRIKIWGRARVIEDDRALIEKLMPAGTKARPERVILIDVAAWDTNCPQHIPQKIDGADVARAIGELERRIAELEAENAKLRARS
ncbi:MAG TPA: pyridoxamine 5'-phosphate oxidase family protein [Polyangiaceae bacterium]|nr:pyridoxamine 5'-phosphate oxidase family protein [Polyangiaceae bacterium]